MSKNSYDEIKIEKPKQQNLFEEAKIGDKIYYNPLFTKYALKNEDLEDKSVNISHSPLSGIYSDHPIVVLKEATSDKHRVVYLRDFPEKGIPAGYVGGVVDKDFWFENKKNDAPLIFFNSTVSKKRASEHKVVIESSVIADASSVAINPVNSDVVISNVVFDHSLVEMVVEAPRIKQTGDITPVVEINNVNIVHSNVKAGVKELNQLNDVVVFASKVDVKRVEEKFRVVHSDFIVKSIVPNTLVVDSFVDEDDLVIEGPVTFWGYQDNDTVNRAMVATPHAFLSDETVVVGGYDADRKEIRSIFTKLNDQAGQLEFVILVDKGDDVKAIQVDINHIEGLLMPAFAEEYVTLKKMCKDLPESPRFAHVPLPQVKGKVFVPKDSHFNDCFGKLKNKYPLRPREVALRLIEDIFK